MLDQVSGKGMGQAFQIMFDFEEGTFKYSPNYLGAFLALWKPKGSHSPHGEGIFDKLSQPYFCLKPQLSLGRG